MPRMLRDLSEDAQSALCATLEVSLTTTLRGRDDEEFPGRMPIYRVVAYLIWDVDLADGLDEGEVEALYALLRSVPHEEAGGIITVAVASAELALLSLVHSDTWEAADASSGYHEHVAGAILNLRGGGLNADLEDRLVGDGAYALDVALVEVEEHFRGADLGLRTVVRAIEHLEPMLAVVALHPFPINGLENTDAKNDDAHRALVAYWGRIGFEQYKDQIYWLDPKARNARLAGFR